MSSTLANETVIHSFESDSTILSEEYGVKRNVKANGKSRYDYDDHNSNKTNLKRAHMTVLIFGVVFLVAAVVIYCYMSCFDESSTVDKNSYTNSNSSLIVSKATGVLPSFSHSFTQDGASSNSLAGHSPSQPTRPRSAGFLGAGRESILENESMEERVQHALENYSTKSEHDDDKLVSNVKLGEEERLQSGCCCCSSCCTKESCVRGWVAATVVAAVDVLFNLTFLGSCGTVHRDGWLDSNFSAEEWNSSEERGLPQSGIQKGVFCLIPRAMCCPATSPACGAECSKAACLGGTVAGKALVNALTFGLFGCCENGCRERCGDCGFNAARAVVGSVLGLSELFCVTETIMNEACALCAPRLRVFPDCCGVTCESGPVTRAEEVQVVSRVRPTRPRTSAGSVQLYLKMLSGRTVMVEVDMANDTVDDVKRKVHVKEGILPEYQQLICGGRELIGARTMREYELNRVATVHLLDRTPREVTAASVSTGSATAVPSDRVAGPHPRRQINAVLRSEHPVRTREQVLASNPLWATAGRM